MRIDEAALARARRMDREAVAQVLGELYPSVYRIAAALTGSAAAGLGAARYVLRQAVRQLPRFRDVDAVERWTYHFTVLTARRARAKVEAADDPLLRLGQPSDAAYAAFVRGLRGLPHQQREALLLTHGQRLNERYVAVAMDCSTKAAEQHLAAGTAAMRALAGQAYDEQLRRVAGAYAAIAPDESELSIGIRRLIAGALWPRRLRLALRILLAAALLGGAAYLATRYADLIRSYLP